MIASEKAYLTVHIMSLDTQCSSTALHFPIQQLENEIMKYNSTCKGIQNGIIISIKTIIIYTLVSTYTNDNISSSILTLKDKLTHTHNTL